MAIANALENDIRSGRLAAGIRLPTHRQLAYVLGTAPGTISRAYEEAARRGLVAGEVGRGTFVRGNSASVEVQDELVVEEPAQRNVIDLGLNLSAVGQSEELLQNTLSNLGRQRDLSPLLEYKPAGGMRSHRESGALWIERWGVEASASQIVVCNGAQHGLLISLLSLARQGDTILTE
ncbi:MAG: GntR family transcriptional regulator, partial [Alphaproteobacteria bacterium]|nr:GntR family transcriptional regulator [Alphaproteobacteria bacterium]